MADQQDNKPEFEVIRRTPPAQESSPVMPLVGIALLLVLGIGGYLLMGGEENGKKGGDDPNASPTVEAPDQPPPDYVWEPIDFATDQGQLQRALDLVEEALVDYPNSRELKSRRGKLRRELGLGGAASAVGGSVASLLSQAKDAMGQGDYDDALEALGALLQQDDEHAEAYFLQGRCYGELGNSLDALASFEDAKALGYDANAVENQMRKYR